MRPLPDMQLGRVMTLRCAAYIADQALNRPYAQVGQGLGIDEKTVRQIAGEAAEAQQALRRSPGTGSPAGNARTATSARQSRQAWRPCQ
jgi:hypothetical protein